MAIDILYIVGTGSKFDNRELLYSLRSLDKFGKNVGRVIISGYCPDFIDKDKIVHVECEDIATPSVNHWWKVKQAFKVAESNKVLLMYDDIFFCKDVYCENYPYYFRGELPSEDKLSKWGHIQYLAKSWLSKRGLPTKHYGVHTPFIYEREKFEKLDKVFQGFKAQGGVSVRSLYGNVYVTGATQRDDIKIFVDYWDMDQWVKDKECFSTAPDNFDKAPEKWLRENFKEKSRWEK